MLLRYPKKTRSYFQNISLLFAQISIRNLTLLTAQGTAGLSDEVVAAIFSQVCPLRDVRFEDSDLTDTGLTALVAHTPALQVGPHTLARMTL